MTTIVLNEAEKGSTTGQKFLLFMQAELVRLRERNDAPMEHEKRVELIAKIQVYKELLKLYDKPVIVEMPKGMS